MKLQKRNIEDITDDSRWIAYLFFVTVLVIIEQILIKKNIK